MSECCPNCGASRRDIESFGIKAYACGTTIDMPPEPTAMCKYAAELRDERDDLREWPGRLETEFSVRAQNRASGAVTSTYQPPDQDRRTTSARQPKRIVFADIAAIVFIILTIIFAWTNASPILVVGTVVLTNVWVAAAWVAKWTTTVGAEADE